MPPLLNLSVENRNDVAVVTVDGPVDSATFAQFKETLDPLVKRRGATVLLDCSNMSYVNSTTLGLLLAYHRSALVNMGRFALCGVNAKVVRTMELLGVGKRLRTYDSREEAVSDLSNSKG